MQPVPDSSRQGSLPRPSPDENLPFLLDEDPSRGSSKQGSQTGSSAHVAQLPGPLPGQAGPQLQQPQPSLHREPERPGMIQQKRAWSLEAKQALQVHCDPLRVKACSRRIAFTVEWCPFEGIMTLSRSPKTAILSRAALKMLCAVRQCDLTFSLTSAAPRCRPLRSRRQSARTAWARSQCRSLLPATLSSSHQVSSMWLSHA